MFGQEDLSRGMPQRPWKLPSYLLALALFACNTMPTMGQTTSAIPSSNPTLSSPFSVSTIVPSRQPSSSPSAVLESSNPTVIATLMSVPPSQAPSTAPTPPPVFTFQNKTLEYFTEPLSLWTTVLSGTGSLRKPGARRYNSVSISPENELMPGNTLLYVTTDNGTLHILEPNSGTELTAVNVKSLGSDWSVRCNSGVSFSRPLNASYVNISLVIYAVNDVPPDNSTLGMSSRVIAVSHPSGLKLWESPVTGQIVGTPAIGSSGKYIYLNRNVAPTTNVSDIESGVGYFTLLSVEEQGEVVYTEHSSRNILFAPLALARKAVINNTQVIEDVAVWGQAAHSTGENRSYYMSFQLPSFNETATQIKELGSVSWTTVHEPTLSEDGQDLYFTTSYAGIRGWSGGRAFNKSYSWKRDLAKNVNDTSQGVLNSASLSHGGSKVFAVAPGDEMYGLETVNGTILWNQTTRSVIYSAPKVSPDDLRVYAIESLRGAISAYDATTGKKYWTINCATFQSTNPFCRYGVEAEFSLSSDGTTLYYGDVYGKVMARKLGNLTTPIYSSAPSAIESTSPSFVPSSVPTLTVSAFPSVFPTQLGSPRLGAFPSAQPTERNPNSPSAQPIEQDAQSNSLTTDESPPTETSGVSSMFTSTSNMIMIYASAFVGIVFLSL